MKRTQVVNACLQVLVLMAPAFATAQVSRSPVVEQVFKNENCAETDSCDLKEFKLEVNEYRVKFDEGGPSFGTNAKASYRTDKVENLEKYALVQYIRGCKFNTLVMPNGTVGAFETVREAFGGKIAFNTTEWDVDTPDEDPMYNNGPADNRHGYYKFDKNGEKKFYINEKPTEPTLYVTPMPGSASMDSPDDMASNISLQYEVCVYKTADLPVSVKEGGGKLPGALKCFPWKSSYVYDHTENKFTSPAGLLCPRK